MSDDLDFDDDNDTGDEEEFVGFVNKLTESNRKLQIRREIERREESRRMSDALGLDNFELHESY